jgi:LEA14-like dessication related protein
MVFSISGISFSKQLHKIQVYHMKVFILELHGRIWFEVSESLRIIQIEVILQMHIANGKESPYRPDVNEEAHVKEQVIQ